MAKDDWKNVAKPPLSHKALRRMVVEYLTLQHNHTRDATVIGSILAMFQAAKAVLRTEPGIHQWENMAFMHIKELASKHDRAGCFAGGLICDAMGMGKTFSTIAYIAAMKQMGQKGTTLVFAPTRDLLEQWDTCASQKVKANFLRVVRYHKTMSASTLKDYDVVLATYDQLAATRSSPGDQLRTLFSIPPIRVVMDEAHCLKDTASKRNAFIKSLVAFTATRAAASDDECRPDFDNEDDEDDSIAPDYDLLDNCNASGDEDDAEEGAEGDAEGDAEEGAEEGAEEDGEEAAKDAKDVSDRDGSNASDDELDDVFYEATPTIPSEVGVWLLTATPMGNGHVKDIQALLELLDCHVTTRDGMCDVLSKVLIMHFDSDDMQSKLPKMLPPLVWKVERDDLIEKVHAGIAKTGKSEESMTLTKMQMFEQTAVDPLVMFKTKNATLKSVRGKLKISQRDIHTAYSRSQPGSNNQRGLYIPPLVKRLYDGIKSLNDGNKKPKFVYFAKYKHEVQIIATTLTKMGIQCVQYTGGCQENRTAALHMFNGSAQGFIATLSSAAVGLDLQAASVAIFFTLDYNPFYIAQAQGRVQRMGKAYGAKCQIVYMSYDGDNDYARGKYQSMNAKMALTMETLSQIPAHRSFIEYVRLNALDYTPPHLDRKLTSMRVQKGKVDMLKSPPARRRPTQKAMKAMKVRMAKDRMKASALRAQRRL